MKDQSNNGDREIVSPTSKTMDSGMSRESPITVLKGGLKMFADIALTVSRNERLELMISRYGSHVGKLRDLFGWDSKTKREMMARDCDEFPESLVEVGSPIPIKYLSLLGVGQQDGARCAVFSTNLDFRTLERRAKSLSTESVRKMFSVWRDTNPELYVRATQSVSECLQSPLPAEEISAILSSKSASHVVAFLGDKSMPSEIPSIGLGLDNDGEYLVALLVALFGQCPLGWLMEDQELENIESTLHPLTASLLCAQFDPGIKWTGTSLDGSARKLELENGIRQVLLRPGIPLSKHVSASLWQLLGTLAPREGGEVSVWGTTREKSIGIGILFPKLPSMLFFGLLQSGLSPAVRRIVGITPTTAPVDTARLVSGMLTGCEQASRKSMPSTVVLNAFFGLERLLQGDNQTFGLKPYKPSLDGEGEGESDLFSITAFVAELEAGRIPAESTIQALRSHFLERNIEDELSNPMRIRIGKILMCRILVVLMRWLLRPEKVECCPPPNGNTWERDSNVILRQKRILRKAKAVAEKLSQKQSVEILVEIIKRAIVFRFTKKTHDPQSPTGSHFAKLIAFMSDALMVLVKRSSHGMVLEQRLWEEISLGCNLTVACELDGVFRYPDADAPEAPIWLRQCGADPDDLVAIDLSPLCESLRASPRIRRQVESIADICECAAGAGLPLCGLSELCRIRWDDDISLLTTLSSEIFVRELRPPTQISRSELTSWWLSCFGVSDGAVFNDQRRYLGLLFDNSPEAAVIALLNVASADQSSMRASGRRQRLVVHVSKSEVIREFRRATFRDKTPCGHRKNDDGKLDEKDDEKEGSTGTRNSEAIEAEERLFQLIRECRKEEAQKLLHSEEQADMENLVELKRILQNSYDNFGRASFSALLKEAVSEMNSADREAVETLVWECIEDSRE